MGDSFTHLHLHTEFSMLDGAARVQEVVAAAAADGQPAIGITDHGNMYGVLDFYRACQEQGLKPIIGTEAYMAWDHRDERPRRTGRIDDNGGGSEGTQKPWYHLTLLAESNQGYKNLMKLSSDAYLEGYWGKPRADWELLERHHEGIIATTGCLGGVVLQSLLADQFEQAVKLAGRLQDIFGRDHLFVELQDHGLPEQHRTNPQLIEIARRIQAPLLATNDSHYTHREDHLAHDALLCVQTGATIDDPNRFKFNSDQHYLKTAAEMRQLFRHWEEACDNTLWIAERADVTIEFGNPTLPRFPIPAGFTGDAEYLRHLSYEGARMRYGEPVPAAVRERLDYELGVISDMGFSSYFLVVWDLIRHAKESGIRVGPGRGSAAGCCVAYCLRITELDPIRYDLLFERFLNPGRRQMPDIDMDFDSRYRSEMIRYASEKYGWDHVAQIVTFSTIKARAAVRDAARVLGYPYAVGDRIAKAMPPLVMGRDTPLWACFEQHEKFSDGYKAAAELRAMYGTDPEVKSVVDVARGLEGLRRQDGIHAAAVVITKDPLTEYLPIQRKPGAGESIEDAPIVTQYEMHGVEELGLLKMDFLGLRNLDVIEMALDIIEQSRGERPDIDAVPLDDEATLALLRRGDSIGVFQLEGGPMRALMRALAPTSFDDVAALVALYRPGPMAANMHMDYADRKNGRKPVTLPHPDAEEVLAATYGLCLAGDTIVHEVATGRPTRLDEVDPAAGFWIQGLDDDFNPAVRQVTHWVCNGERETFQLRLLNGMAVTGTADHPVLTYDGWKRLGDLTADDLVAVPHELVEPPVPQPIDQDRLRILGYLVGDGGLSNSSVIQFTNRDHAVLAAMRESVAAVFPTVRVSEHVTERGVHALKFGNGRGHGGGASPMLRWLRELGLKAPAGARPGGPTSEGKFLPEAVFSLSNADLAVLVAALWDCDGHVSPRYAHYRTISSTLASQLQTALLRLGFDAVVYNHPYQRPGDGATVLAYQVTVYDGERFTRLIQPHLRCPKKAAVRFQAQPKGSTLDRQEVAAAVRAVWPGTTRELAAEYGVPRLTFQPYAVRHHPRVHARTVEAVIRGLELADLAVLTNVQWVPVDDVRPAGMQLVYDIQVEEIHNFVANGIVVHNCIFQEQIMRIAQKFAGYSLEEADNLRKACGKKVREVMAKEREKFVAGCERTGYGAELGNTWFDIIEPFADYAFNKSHSFGYGFISFQTAWLKAHYPVEYLAALLTSVKADKDATAKYLAECRAVGVPVLVPDINASMSDFSVRDGAIPFGLSAIRNVGEGLVAHIVAEREANGPFRDFYDFCERVDIQVLNKRTVESLIKAGAFDSLGHPRQGLCLVFEQIIDRTVARRREEEQGVMSLFGELQAPSGDEPAFSETRVPIPDQDFDKTVRLAFEKEMLGLYVSDHPLMGVEAALRRLADASITELQEAGDGEIRTVGGVITSLARKYTKKGDLMATFVLEDLEGAIDAWVFPRTMQECGAILADDAVVCVKGRVDKREDTPKFVVMDVRRVELTPEGPPLRIVLPLATLTDAKVKELKALLLEHPGDAPVYLHVGAKVLRLPEEFRADAGNGLLAEIRVLLGPQAVLGEPL